MSLDTSRHYQFELFLHLYGLFALNGPLSKDKAVFFIDEFQDFSEMELSLYKGIYPNGIFNLYGDEMQAINTKGITKTEVDNFTQKWERYEINENYRNAYEITEFINKTFATRMLPIGISGEINQIDTLTSVDIEKDDRAVLIVKDIATLDKAISDKVIGDKIARGGKRREKDNFAFEPGLLNIMPVSLVKGLEFEKVYVLPDGMTKNEKYLSCSRALDTLTIIGKI